MFRFTRGVNLERSDSLSVFQTTLRRFGAAIAVLLLCGALSGGGSCVAPRRLLGIAVVVEGRPHPRPRRVVGQRVTCKRRARRKHRHVATVSHPHAAGRPVVWSGRDQPGSGIHADPRVEATRRRLTSAAPAPPRSARRLRWPETTCGNASMRTPSASRAQNPGTHGEVLSASMTVDWTWVAPFSWNRSWIATRARAKPGTVPSGGSPSPSAVSSLAWGGRRRQRSRCSASSAPASTPQADTRAGTAGGVACTSECVSITQGRCSVSRLKSMDPLPH